MKYLLLLLCLSLSGCAINHSATATQNVDVPVVLAARFTITDQGREEFLRLANATLAPTRKEPGCISYAFYQLPDDINTFIYFEQWQSREALSKHLKQPYVTRLINAFGGLLDGEADIRVYDVKSMSYGLGDLL